MSKLKKKNEEYKAKNDDYAPIRDIIHSKPKQRTWKTLWLKPGIELFSAILGLIAAIIGLFPNDSGQPQICNVLFGACGDDFAIYLNRAAPSSSDICPDGTLYDSFNLPCNHDEDSDTVHDAVDACPSLGDKGFGLNYNGCPKDEPTAISPTETSPATATAIATELNTPIPLTDKVCIATDDVWLRGEPNAFSQDIKAILASGTSVTVQGQAYPETGEYNGKAFFQYWWKITVSGLTGWIEEQHLTTCGGTVSQIIPTTNPDYDNDGVLNAADQCPNTWGTVNGCPDGDADGIIDKNDACPSEYGTTANGCPQKPVNVCSDNSAYDNYNDPCNHDEDNDGILDTNDACPALYGTSATSGCPDSDGDGVIDSNDKCPNRSGSLVNEGCPDSDGDGIIDDVDNCPSISNSDQADSDQDGIGNVCDDSDGDGVVDDVDQCPNEYGTATNKGCPAVTITEDCIPFNPSNLTVENVNGNWTIVEGGNHLMMSFGSSESEANQAYNIITYYGANSTCYVGRPGPSLTYLRVSGTAPQGAFSGEDCLYFNPNTIEVTYVSGRWKIVDGSHWMLDFDQNESEARLSHAILQRYAFSYICFVGRPGASLTYFRR